MIMKIFFLKYMCKKMAVWIFIYKFASVNLIQNNLEAREEDAL